MKSLEEIKKIPCLQIIQTANDGGMGFIRITPGKAQDASVVWSNGGGWDHVSVAFRDRCPTWNEMSKVKDLFFKKDECCVEYHPAESNYVNLHPYCLHIWRPQNVRLPKPPTIFV